jgi:hypothetical protein
MKFASITRRLTLLSFFISLLCACATANGPLFQAVDPAPSGLAQIYIYRVQRFYGGAMNNQVFGLPPPSASTKSYVMPNGSWRKLLVAPGTYGLSVQDSMGTMGCGALTMSVEAGSTTFLEMEGVLAGMNAGFARTGCTFKIQSKEKALLELPSLKQID